MNTYRLYYIFSTLLLTSTLFYEIILKVELGHGTIFLFMNCEFVLTIVFLILIFISVHNLLTTDHIFLLKMYLVNVYNYLLHNYIE